MQTMIFYCILFLYYLSFSSEEKKTWQKKVRATARAMYGALALGADGATSPESDRLQ